MKGCLELAPDSSLTSWLEDTRVEKLWKKQMCFQVRGNISAIIEIKIHRLHYTQLFGQDSGGKARLSEGAHKIHFTNEMPGLNCVKILDWRPIKRNPSSYASQLKHENGVLDNAGEEIEARVHIPDNEYGIRYTC